MLFRSGLACAPSQGRLSSGAAFNQRFIQACGGDLEFARPLTAARPGWPLPLMQLMACLVPSSYSRVLGMLTNAVEVMCRMVDTAVSEDELTKHPKKGHGGSCRHWSAQSGGVKAASRSDQPPPSCQLTGPARRSCQQKTPAGQRQTQLPGWGIVATPPASGQCAPGWRFPRRAGR